VAFADWRFLISDVNGNIQGELLGAKSRAITYLLHDRTIATGSINGRDPQAELLQETTSDLIVYREPKKIFRGRMGTTSDTIDQDSHDVQWSAQDYRGMLSRRIVPEGGLTYTNVDQSTIAWNLINASQAQTGGNWGITRGMWTPSVNRTAAYVAGTYLDQAITDLSNLDAGFDYEIDANLMFKTWPVPSTALYTGLGRGQNIGMVLTYGDNVRHVYRTIDTTQFSNVIRLSGSSTTGSVLTSVDVVGLYTGNFGQAGRWETQLANSDITDVTRLTAAALAALTEQALLIPSFQLTLTNGWWDPDQLWLGDIVRVVLHSGRLVDDWTARVIQISVTLGDDSNEENVVITVGTLIGNLLKRIQAQETSINKVTRTST
jgi:hypothetical protein